MKNPVRVAAGFKAAKTKRGETPSPEPNTFDTNPHRHLLDYLRTTNPEAYLRVMRRRGNLL